MVEEVPGSGIRSWFRAALVGASFWFAVAAARPAAAEDGPTRAHQQQFKLLMRVGMGDAGPSNGAFELQINRSWFGVTPLLGIRFDVLFNTPPPVQSWPPARWTNAGCGPTEPV